jgi:hypothetical protein
MPPERPYEHWMELVRTFRTYYDHFRIAFPHLASISKYYDKNWGGEFRALSREFVRNEDMHAVKHVFDSAGYGTERWDKLVSLNPEDLTGRFNQIIALNGFAKTPGEEPPTSTDPGERLTHAQGILGKDLWALLLDSPESFVNLLDSVSSVPESPDASTAAPPDVDTPIVVTSPEPPVTEESDPQVVDPAITRLIDAVGEEQWALLLHDPDLLVNALKTESQSERVELSDPQTIEVKEDSEVGEASPLDDASEVDEASTPDGAGEHLKALQANQEEKKDLEAAFAKVQEELAEAVKASEKFQQELEDRAREQAATAKKIASIEEKLKEAEAKAQKSRVPEKPTIVAPTKASQQLQETEQSLQKAEARLGELESKTETDELRIKELMEDLRCERHLREKYEDDLEETRNALKEQIQRLHAVLKNEEQIPTLDEFEEMESDELLEYIGDIEKEKQKVMAGLDALDTQEEGYQKQIEAQNEQMGAIQEDMGKLKESTLAMEVEELRETLEKKKSQLQMLMGYSKNLKSRNEQLVDRQEPLRNLVQKLNLQEKALVRFVRMNYDGKFMPESAYL